MTQSHIPSKRSHSGYHGSEAIRDLGFCLRDCANFTAEFVQNTSQHENAMAIVITRNWAMRYGLIIRLFSLPDNSKQLFS